MLQWLVDGKMFGLIGMAIGFWVRGPHIKALENEITWLRERLDRKGEK